MQQGKDGHHLSTTQRYIDVHSDPNLIAYKEAYWKRRDWFNQMLKDI